MKIGQVKKELKLENINRTPSLFQVFAKGLLVNNISVRFSSMQQYWSDSVHGSTFSTESHRHVVHMENTTKRTENRKRQTRTRRREHHRIRR